MRLFIRSILLISGTILLLITIGSYILRQEPSTAFWVLGQQGKVNKFFFNLTSPNGGVQHPLFSSKPSNRVDFLGWIPNTQKLLYIFRTDNEIYQLHLHDFQSNTDKILLTDHYSGGTQEFEKLLWASNEEWVIMPLQNRDGVAYFRLNYITESLERITPYYYDVTPLVFSFPEYQEWFFYEATRVRGSVKTLYRQHFDGSERTEIAEFDTSPYLIVYPNQDVYLSVWNPNMESDIYRLASGDDELQLVVSKPHLLLPYYALDTDWLYLSEPGLPNQSRLYRVRPNGDDFSLINEEAEYQQSPLVIDDDLFYAQLEDDLTAIYEFDLASLSQQEIFHATGTISRLQPFADRTGFIFELIEEDRHSLYRINLDGSNLRRILDTGSQEIEQLITYVDPEWILLAFDSGTPNQPHITYYRVSINSGEMDELFVLTTRTTHVQFSAGPDGGTLIATESRNNGNEIVNQYAVRLSDGNVNRGEFGHNLRFSPTIDTDWHTDTLLILGLVLLITAVFPYHKFIANRPTKINAVFE